MRIVVVGATGNVGTAVLAALQRNEEIDSIMGIARRVPSDRNSSDDAIEWASIDIAAAIEPGEAVAQLTDAFTGADAVIHLAWLIQPNTQRDLLRRVNVEGTRHVAAAVARAGVPTLVVASSVGAYAPSPGTRTRDESWPTTAIRTSHYSVDKAAQEAVLDEFEAEHPDVTVTRLRPALIFQSRAGSEIHRYFIGERLPAHLLGSRRLPALPLPRGIAVQAVHADDVAEAYAAAAVLGRHGAFNICAEGLLDASTVAEIFDQARIIEVPVPLARAVLAGGHRARLVAADPGWLDMAMNAPTMDTTRARTELGWTPRHSAADALRDLLDGLIDGRGAESMPLRPRNSRRAELPITAERPSTLPGQRPVSPRIDRGLLNLYLSDHLTGASAGSARITRMAADFLDTPVFPVLSELAEEIRIEKDFLEDLIRGFGMRRLRHRQVIAALGERVGRLKANGRIVSRSPMTMVLEVELMRSAVIGKRGVWQILAAHAEDLGVDPGPFHDLADNALRQHEELDRVHAFARQRAFREDAQTFG